MSSSSILVTAKQASTRTKRSTRSPKASSSAASSSSMPDRGVKRSMDDRLAEEGGAIQSEATAQNNNVSALKKSRPEKAAGRAVQQIVQEEMITALTGTSDSVPSTTPAKQRKPRVKKEAQPKRDAKLKAQPKVKKEVQPKKEPKPKKLTKAGLQRAKFDEVCSDPNFARLGADAVKRIVKVYMDRLYLIHRHRHGETLKEEFDVYGSQGNVYKVTLAGRPSCSCIDFMLRKKPCKHLLFVYLKVLRLPSHMPVYSHLVLSQDDLCDVFAVSRLDPVAEAMASPDLRKAWEAVVGYKPDAAASSSKDIVVMKPEGKRMLPTEGDVCGVCYEDLEPASEEGLEFCLRSCGRPIHKDCLATWISSRSYGPPTCIWCRAVWHTAPAHHGPGPRNADRIANGYGIGTDERGGVIDPNTGYVLNLAHVVARGPALAS